MHKVFISKLSQTSIVNFQNLIDTPDLICTESPPPPCSAQLAAQLATQATGDENMRYQYMAAQGLGPQAGQPFDPRDFSHHSIFASMN